MRPFDRSGPTHLSRYWAALVQNASPAELERLAARLDPEMIVSIDQMRSLRGDPQPDPAFVTRLEDRLMNAHAGAISMPNGSRPALIAPEPRVHLRPPAGVRRSLPLILAATVLIALIGALAAALLIDRSEPERRAAGPAILAPATPADETSTDRTLMEFLLAADALPSGEDTSAGLARFIIPAGTNSTWSDTCCTGPLMEYVIAGAYTVRAQDPITVFRADGTVEAVAADTAVTLTAGDALLSRNGTTVEASNTGTEPVDLLSWVMTDNTPIFNEHRLAGWTTAGTRDVHNPLDPIAGPAVVTLRQVTAPNGTSVAAPDGGTSIQFGMPANPDEAFIGHRSDGSVQVFGEVGEPVTVYILTFTQAGGETGTPVS
jgi:hypothetical protein